MFSSHPGMSEPAIQRTRRKVILVLFVLVVSATGWWLLSAKPSDRLTVRFWGYTEGKPYAEMSSAVLGAQVSAQLKMRVAQLTISNGNDFPVSCLLTVRYTNRAWGAFVPPNVQLAPHTASNAIGVIVPTAGNAPPANYPSSPDWTRPWRVKLYASEASPLQGIRASRERTAVWLWQHNYYRLGNFINSRKVQRIETDLIPPDSLGAE